MTFPKRHHILPRFYLDGFCKDGLLWVYDRQVDEFRKQSPINTAVITHYYTIEDEKGEKQSGVETILSQIESLAKPVIEKLIASENVSPQDRADLAIFIAIQFLRVPAFEHMFNDLQDHAMRKLNERTFSSVDKIKEILERASGLDDETRKVDPEVILEIVDKGEYSIEFHRNDTIRAMLELSLKFSIIFQQMDWVIAHCSDDTSFITSDYPFTLIPPQNYTPNSFMGVGILTEGTIKLFPICQTCCLILKDKGDAVIHVQFGKSNVRQSNLSTSYNSERYLIARDEKLLRNLVRKTRINKTTPAPRFKIM